MSTKQKRISLHKHTNTQTHNITSIKSLKMEATTATQHLNEFRIDTFQCNKRLRLALIK